MKNDLRDLIGIKEKIMKTMSEVDLINAFIKIRKYLLSHINSMPLNMENNRKISKEEEERVLEESKIANQLYSNLKLIAKVSQERKIVFKTEKDFILQCILLKTIPKGKRRPDAFVRASLEALAIYVYFTGISKNWSDLGYIQDLFLRVKKSHLFVEFAESEKFNGDYLLFMTPILPEDIKHSLFPLFAQTILKDNWWKKEKLGDMYFEDFENILHGLIEGIERKNIEKEMEAMREALDTTLYENRYLFLLYLEMIDPKFDPNYPEFLERHWNKVIFGEADAEELDYHNLIQGVLKLEGFPKISDTLLEKLLQIQPIVDEPAAYILETIIKRREWEE